MRLRRNGREQRRALASHAAPALAALAAAALACAAPEANRAGEGGKSAAATSAGESKSAAAAGAHGAAGSFAPSKGPAAQYGGSGSSGCPTAGPAKAFADELGRSSGAGRAQADGRLCAAADALLAWKQQDLPPEAVNRFIASYFGIPSPPARAYIATIESDDARLIAQRLAEAAQDYLSKAAAPRYGLATQRIGGGGDRRSSAQTTAQTRVALLLQDEQVELQPTPRQVPAGGRVALSGKLLGGVTQPQVLACTPGGKLESPPAQQGDAFNAEVACGDQPGTMNVEIRGQKDGKPTIVGRFPVGCGAELPRSVAVPAAGPAQPAAPEAQEKQMFEALNALRRDARLTPLAWDDAVASVARSASESYRAEAGGSATSFDIAGKLKQSDVASPIVLVNPVAATSVDEAQALVASSAVNRCNALSHDVTHAGVGVVQANDPNAGQVVYVTEIMVRELPQVDPEQVRAKLREAIARKRADARAPAVASDPVLEDIAQKYATALAAGKGDLPKAQESAIVAPLYKSFRNVNILAGAKAEPLDFAEEPSVTGQAKVIGVGAAQGVNPVLGKNAVYVVLLIGSRR